MKRCIPILLLVCFLQGNTLAQGTSGKVSPFRTILSKFNFGFSTGYGRTWYNHNTEPFYTGYSPDIGTYLFETPGNPGDSIQVFTNWINDAVSSGRIVDPNDVWVAPDTADLKFRGKAWSIPFNAFVFFTFDRYRIGGGYSLEFHKVNSFSPDQFADQIGPMDPGMRLTTWQRWYGMFGGTIYEIYDWSFIGDVEFGSLKLGRQFNPALIDKGIYFNIGITAEYAMSEYFKVFVRPNYEFKSYRLTVSESGQTLTHRQPALYINIGFTYRIPELPRCTVQQCRTQMNHVHKHNGKEYRSKVHPFWKKQNPNYGENYKKLFRYKWKNKRKLHAY